MKYNLTTEQIRKACDDARKRVSKMSPEQKAELEKRARKSIAQGRKRK